MTRDTARHVKKGIGFGIGAGILFAIVEMIAAGMMGDPPLAPVRMFGSVVLGEDALSTTSLGVALLAGVGVHLVLSAAFGALYGLLSSRVSPETRSSFARQAALGLGFGALLWLVDFQVIARMVYPWFLMAPQLVQLVLHAVFFGLPLGLMIAADQRRVHGREQVPV